MVTNVSDNCQPSKCLLKSREVAEKMNRTSPIRAGDRTTTPATLRPTRRSSVANRGQASCQVTAFMLCTPPSEGEKNWTLASPELFLRRLPLLPPVPLRTELLRLMEFLFRSEFWWDSSLFCRVWIKMDGFSSNSLALHNGVDTLDEKNREVYLPTLALAYLRRKKTLNFSTPLVPLLSTTRQIVFTVVVLVPANKSIYRSIWTTAASITMLK